MNGPEFSLNREDSPDRYFIIILQLLMWKPHAAGPPSMDFSAGPTRPPTCFSRSGRHRRRLGWRGVVISPTALGGAGQRRCPGDESPGRIRCGAIATVIGKAGRIPML